MTALQALAVCLLLVLIDLYVRAVRIQLLVRGLGHRLTLWDAFVLNNWGDAACALTPLRIGGEPARLAGMLRSGVPASAALVAITLELLVAWPIIIVAAAWLLWHYAPQWGDMAGPRLAAAVMDAWPWGLALLIGSLWVWSRIRPAAASPTSGRMGRSIRRPLTYLRRMPRGILLATVPLSFLNLATRVAILPVLVLTLSNHPPLGLVTLGSFGLLYSQLLLPTPSGAGAVELGFLGGAAGELGRDEAALLLAWRLYTSGIGILLGLLLAVQAWRRPALASVRWGRDRD